MRTTWTDANGEQHDIKTMPTAYIENCLSVIDELMPKVIKRLNENGERVASAQHELKTKQEQKAEMLRVLHERRRSVAPVTVHSCYTCKHSDTVLNQLICKKLNNFCFFVNFSCGAWEK